MSATETENVEVCGETFDHNLREISPGTFECRRCGAEIFEEVES